MPKKQLYDVHPNEWPRFLTRDLERHFERIGEELVRHDIAARNYREPEKHFAAIHWLQKKRTARKAESLILKRIAIATLVIASLTFLATLLT